MNLLLIDDDEELCAELAILLATEGYVVDVAYDGMQGLCHLQEKQYQIIILDLKLPGLNGYGVLKRVRESIKPFKILVLSGRPMGELLLKENGVSQEEEDEILDMADIVINKPFMIDIFLQKIKTLSLLVVEEGQ